MIEWARVEELITEIGAEDFGEVVELFLEEVDAALDGLDASQANSQGAQTLHQVKGCAWNLGFTELGELCLKLEAGGALTPPEVVQELKSVYLASRAVLKEGLDARAIVVTAA